LRDFIKRELEKRAMLGLTGRSREMIEIDTYLDIDYRGTTILTSHENKKYGAKLSDYLDSVLAHLPRSTNNT
jgi:hypothetical protein